MATSTTSKCSTPPTPTVPATSASLLRRREKRRLPAVTTSTTTSVSSSTVHGSPTDLWLAPFFSTVEQQQPAELVALAVRYDEGFGEESILQQRLETGRLYDNRREFLAALRVLRQCIGEQQQQHTTRLQHHQQQGGGVASWTTRTSPGKTQDDAPKQQQQQALTPIILSGLLTAIEEQREEGSNANLFSEESTTKLVQACEAMRQAALNRVRTRKKRLSVQGTVLPILCISVLVALYLRAMAMQRRLLHQLDYLHSCDSMPAYAPACRLAEAWLWFKYRDSLFLLQLHLSGRSPNIQSNMLEKRYIESPFSMHSTLSRNLITKRELMEGLQRPTSIPQAKAPSDLLTDDDADYNRYRWLGESTVNRLVREAVETHSNETFGMNRRIVDVGCGVGATLYALLPDRPMQTMRYDGITASAAETHFARRLLAIYGNTPLSEKHRHVNFVHQSFDRPLPALNYTVAVAIESLSYSRNLASTIANIVKSLVVGGVLVIVDDVLLPDGRSISISKAESTLRPSLVPHSIWVTTLEAANCSIVSYRDLSLQYEVILDRDLSSLSHHRSLWLWAVRVWSPVLARVWWTLGCESWVHVLRGYTAVAHQRWVELHDDRHQLLELWKRRQIGFGEATIYSYNMYVCVKR